VCFGGWGQGNSSVHTGENERQWSWSIRHRDAALKTPTSIARSCRGFPDRGTHVESGITLRVGIVKKHSIECGAVIGADRRGSFEENARQAPRRCKVRWFKFVAIPNCLCLLIAFSSFGCGEASRGDLETDVVSSETPQRSLRIATPIGSPYVIEITGHEYRWHVRYPGEEWDAASSGEARALRDVHVPADTEIDLVLKSRDFVYSLSLPQFQRHELAVPDLEFHLKFLPRMIGRFELIGDEFCGDPHPDLTGALVVDSQDQFLKWLNDQHSTSRK
jgi:heme/copper-type cytochrome/quinol oxidase subunit 2